MTDGQVCCGCIVVHPDDDVELNVAADVDDVGSQAAQLPYDYCSLPFCKREKVEYMRVKVCVC